MNTLMKTTLEVADKAEPDAPSDYVVNGQEHLLNTNRALDDVRQIFEAISMKGDILHLLDRCMNSEGVQLFIGSESGYEVLGECSWSLPQGWRLGWSFRVIGPTRMPYDKVISIVDATSKVLSAAMEFQKNKFLDIYP